MSFPTVERMQSIHRQEMKDEESLECDAEKELGRNFAIEVSTVPPFILRIRNKSKIVSQNDVPNSDIMPVEASEVELGEDENVHIESHEHSIDNHNKVDCPRVKEANQILTANTQENQCPEIEIKYEEIQISKYTEVQEVVRTPQSAGGNLVRKVQCSKCDYSSNWKCVLDAHIRNIHVDGNPLNSSERGFISSQNKQIRSDYLKPNFYICPTCNYSADRKEILEEHIRTIHLATKSHKCSECSFSSNHKFHLDEHIEAAHLRPCSGPHDCSVCSYSSSYKSTLEQPVKSAHLQLEQFKCSKCEFFANENIILGRHMESLHNRQFQFSECAYNGNKKNSLEACVESDHLQMRQVACSEIDYSVVEKGILDKHIRAAPTDGQMKLNKHIYGDYSSGSRRNLERHMNSVHVHLKPFKCSKCEFSSNKKQILERHINSVHLKLKPFKCFECDYSSSNKDAIKKHIQAIHLNLNSYKCDQCDFSSSWKRSLVKHTKEIHPQERLLFKCSECQYSSNQVRNLDRHLILAHLRLKLYKCKQCCFSSSVKDALNSHIKSAHTELRPFECAECEYSSSRKGHLDSHIRSAHKKWKLIKCSYCDYSTGWNSYLDLHIKSVHPQMIKPVTERGPVNVSVSLTPPLSRTDELNESPEIETDSTAAGSNSDACPTTEGRPQALESKNVNIVINTMRDLERRNCYCEESTPHQMDFEPSYQTIDVSSHFLKKINVNDQMRTHPRQNMAVQFGNNLAANAGTTFEDVADEIHETQCNSFKMRLSPPAFDHASANEVFNYKIT